MTSPAIGRATRRALLFALCALAVFAGSARAVTGQSAPAAAAPQLPAAAWYLVGEDGTVLAQHAATTPRAIASITKLMTAIVTLEHARLSDVVTIGQRSARVGESTADLRTGEQLPVSTLLRAMLIASANDAAEALALHVGDGSLDRFVGLMNEKARDLGLRNTTFRNPHGLDEAGHLSSAKDATLLIRYALGIPFIRDALDRTSIELPGGRELETTDDLLGDWAPLVGGKTGHTADAGWSEAAAATARGATVYGAVLATRGRDERNAALEELLSYGLDRYRSVAVIDPSRVYAEAETGYGRPSVELVAPRMQVRPVHERKTLVERVFAPVAVDLPVRRGARLGRVEVYDGTRLVVASSLVAAASVSEPGLLGKTLWYAKRTAHNVWGLFT
jgi:D-alanyl-D-alanine carboxypeptidase (penicillin-binding protein 5/6)